MGWGGTELRLTRHSRWNTYLKLLQLWRELGCGMVAELRLHIGRPGGIRTCGSLGRTGATGPQEVVRLARTVLILNLRY